jgi:hypothetical protein
MVFPNFLYSNLVLVSHIGTENLHRRPPAQASVYPRLPFGVTNSLRQRGVLPSALPYVPTLVTVIFHL